MMGGFDNWSEIKPSSYLWGQKDEEVRSIGLVLFLFVDKMVAPILQNYNSWNM